MSRQCHHLGCLLILAAGLLTAPFAHSAQFDYVNDASATGDMNPICLDAVRDSVIVTPPDLMNTVATPGGLRVRSLDVQNTATGDLTLAVSAWRLGTQTFAERQIIGSREDSVISVHAADMDGDGDLDVVSAAFYDNTVKWWENRGPGAPWVMHAIAGGVSGAQSVWAADMDSDGDADVVCVAYYGNRITWWENASGDGSSWIAHVVDSSFLSPHELSVADLDGDGDMDILGAEAGADKAVWFENVRGDGALWIKHIAARLPGVRSVSAADFDGDGDLDVGAINGAGAVRWEENLDGKGTQWEEHIVDNGARGGYVLTSADFNGDGRADLLAAVYELNAIMWWENPGGGSNWIRHVVDSSFIGARAVGAADLDGDGDMDALGAAWWDGSAVWYENVDGWGGQWSKHVLDNAASGVCWLHAADMNGDGTPDVVGAVANADQIRLWLNDMTPSWLRAEPRLIHVPAKGHAEVEITFDATDLIEGDHAEGRIRLAHAGSDALAALVPVSLVVMVDTNANYSLSASSGPYAGGNTITITNGYLGTITNVLVGGVQATILSSGASWVTITVPETGSAGVKDIVIQTSNHGDITLAGAYTVNPPGQIAGRDGLPALITLTNTWFDGTNGVILAGAKTWDQSGYSVSSAGDVNGDGFADLLVGANHADPSGRYAAGEAYLVYGRSSGLPPLITLTNSWLNGTNGIILAGGAANDRSGSSVSSAGDVNGDGFADLLIGAICADSSGRNSAGETYLVYGRSNGLPLLITLTNTWFDGTNGIILAGAKAGDYSGYSVSSAGDVNSDGFADFLVGAFGADPSGRLTAGETYLVYGRSSGLPRLITLSRSWLDGTNGIILAGAKAGDYSGYSVSSAGDVNGDGFADLLIGAICADPSGRSSTGETYLVYGRSNGLPSLITLTNTWFDGTNGIILAGALAGDESGSSVSSAGDVNGDGFADLLVGALSAEPSGRWRAGETYLVYGRSNGLPPLITLTNTWFDGTNGVILAGAKARDLSGYSVSSAGDVNGDGFADLLIGAIGAEPSGRHWAGETYLVYGRSNGLPPLITLTNSWLDGTNGVILAGANTGDSSGWKVSSAGDVNGDGFADLLVAAGSASPSGRSGAGETYLVYGKRSLAPVEPSSGSMTGGYQVIINGHDLGNGSDITDVTLCGVSVASIVSQSATQVVVIAAPSPIGLGDVRVFSTSYGETVASNAFTYHEDQSITSYYVNDAFTNGDVYCTAVGDDANSGRSPSSPKASLQAVLDTYNIEPGDTIWVDAGQYDSSNAIWIGPQDAGSSNGYVTIRGTPLGMTVFNRLSRPAWSPVIGVNGGTDYVILSDFVVQGGYWGVFVAGYSCRLEQVTARQTQAGFACELSVVLEHCVAISNEVGIVGYSRAQWDGGVSWGNITHFVGSVSVNNSVVVGGTALDSDYISGDYNIFWDTILGGGYTNLEQMQTASTSWQHCMVVDPQLADPANMDFHPRSTAGRFDPAIQAWVVDDVDSPCIDMGDPSSSFAQEPAPNGFRRNIGLYGDTAEASRSPTNGRLLALTFNAGGVAAETQLLTWAASGPATSGTVRLDYSLDEGLSWSGLASNVSASMDMHIWNTTLAPNSTQTLWRIVLESDTNVWDMNDKPFVLQSDPPVETNLVVGPADLSMTTWQTQQMTVVEQRSDGSESPVSAGRWFTSDPCVATIGTNGCLWALQAGEVLVWAEAGGITSDCARIDIRAMFTMRATASGIGIITNALVSYVGGPVSGQFVTTFSGYDSLYLPRGTYSVSVVHADYWPSSTQTVVLGGSTSASFDLFPRSGTNDLGPYRYVDAGSTNPVSPYASWATAARGIQQAVDVCPSNATVLVADGVYALTNEVVIREVITLKSVNGPSLTILDGQGVTRCLLFPHSPTGYRVVDGFTMRNGHSDFGGGAKAEGYCRLRNCVLVNNTAEEEGGGLYGGFGSGLFDCTIVSNYARSHGGVSYGGPVGNGGPSVYNSRVLHNRAQFGAGGLYNCSAANCVIAGNEGGDAGGVLDGQMVYCTVSGNVSSNGVGGVVSRNIRDSIIHGNQGPQGDNHSLGSNWTGWVSYVCTTPGLSGTGCMEADPLFRNADGYDFRLRSDSPCIDAGNPQFFTGNDLDHGFRPQDGNLDGLPVADIGALELVSVAAGTPAVLPLGSLEVLDEQGVSPGDYIHFTGLPVGSSYSRDLVLANTGGDIDITAVILRGRDSAWFHVDGLPQTIDALTSSNFSIAMTAPPTDRKRATLVIKHTGQNSPLKLHLRGANYEVLPSSGPYAGGNTITITNGYLGAITNVTVGGVQATILSSGASWVTITVPEIGSAGVKDIVIQTSEHGDITLAGAYTVNPPGQIVGRIGLPPLTTLTDSWLDGTNGVILAGAKAWDGSGYSVSSAGDVNGDGFEDLMIGAYLANPSGRSYAGETYLVYGRSNGLPPLITLNSSWLDGTNGVILAGANADGWSGVSVSSAGDVNGDGFADLLVGAIYADSSGRSEAGETYLVYGRSSGLPPLITLNSSWLDGTNGVILAGVDARDRSGYSVSSAGDVNGDGFSDVLVGAPYAAPYPYGYNSAGETYLVYGRRNGLPPLITLNSFWLNGNNGISLVGAKEGDRSGYSVSSAGDVNGDGFADVLIGAIGADPSGRTNAGETYLVYGRSSGLPSLITLNSSWLDGTNGIILAGATQMLWSGCSVSSAGDVNGDGFADLLVGASHASPQGRSSAGETYLVYGRSSGLPRLITLNSSWLDGTNGIILAGAAAHYYCGLSVSSAGDVNSDGFADLLVGVRYANPSGRPGAGGTYLVYGRRSGLPRLITLNNSWLDGTNGIILAGAKEGDNSGFSVSSAGDVNGDGLADLLIGAPVASPSGHYRAGETYLVYGRKMSRAPATPSSGSMTGGYQVIINGLNLGNGSDITDVTLCSVSVADIVSQSATQVVVIAAPSPIGLGDVRVFSTSYGETVARDAFTYTRDGQTSLNFYVNDAFTNGDMYCTASGHDANSGTSPSSPKASVQAILDAYDMEPGDTIWVDTGDYKLSRTITIGSGDAGTAGDPVVIRGSDNEVAGGSVFRFVSSTSEVTVLQGITNRGFETGSPGLVVPYEPGIKEWKSYSALGARGTWSDAAAQTGNFSMELTVDEGWGSYALISQDVCIHNTNNVSGSVAFEGWFRGDLSRVGVGGERAGAFLKMEFLDASLRQIGSPVENEGSHGRPLFGINTCGSWVRTSIECTNIPQATAYIRFAIGLNTFGSRLPATGWWDNVSAVIELDGGTVTCPTEGLLHIQDASWLTIENLRLLQGIEGIRISGAEGILVSDCEIKENTTGIKSSESTVRIERTRIAGGTYGARCSSGRMDVDGCTLWDNRPWQVWLEGGVGTVSNSILATVNPGGSGVHIGYSATYYGDYNNHYVTANACVGFYLDTNVISLVEWKELLAPQDAHSLCLDPQFVDPGAFDFHLKSRTGSWSVPLQAWIMHDVDSPCIDTADPAAPYSMEPMPNGGHRNMGAYGNTPQASRSTDSDGDGLSDSLELYRIGSNPLIPDSDGDGMPDGDEYLAGMSPTDDGAVFSFDGCSGDEGLLNGSEFVLSWPSVEGRTYRIEWATNLVSGFSVLAEHVVATPPMNTYTQNLNVVDGAFYRLSCEQP